MHFLFSCVYKALFFGSLLKELFNLAYFGSYPWSDLSCKNELFEFLTSSIAEITGVLRVKTIYRTGYMELFFVFFSFTCQLILSWCLFAWLCFRFRSHIWIFSFTCRLLINGSFQFIACTFDSVVNLVLCPLKSLCSLLGCRAERTWRLGRLGLPPMLLKKTFVELNSSAWLGMMPHEISKVRISPTLSLCQTIS